jgi:hypothetical protein
MGVLSIMAIMIEYPWLAFVPAALFFYLHSISKARVTLVTAILWLAYVPYEYAMKSRLLCTGECNIRVDLLLIYTLLVAMSLVSAGMFAASRKKIKRRS